MAELGPDVTVTLDGPRQSRYASAAPGWSRGTTWTPLTARVRTQGQDLHVHSRRQPPVSSRCFVASSRWPPGGRRVDLGSTISTSSRCSDRRAGVISRGQRFRPGHVGSTAARASCRPGVNDFDLCTLVRPPRGRRVDPGSTISTWARRFDRRAGAVSTQGRRPDGRTVRRRRRHPESLTRGHRTDVGTRPPDRHRRNR